MSHSILVVALAGLVTGQAARLPAQGAVDPSESWPQWRGPLGTGVAPLADPPTEWSDEKNVKWKVSLPGLGHSTPLVWGDRLFVTAAIPYGEPVGPIPSTAPGNHDNLPVTRRQRFVALAINRADGKIVWQRTLNEALPKEQGHRTASLASHSPATDGERLFVFFGSFGLYCLDWNGEPVWESRLGEMQSLHGHGEGASPALFGGTLIVNCDHEGQSFVMAIDARTGRTRWRVDRDEITSWSSPIVVEQGGKPQAVVLGTNRIRGYDLETGTVIWECGGLSSNVVASPVAADGMVFAGSSYDKRALLAIHLDGARGDVTLTDRVAWSRIHNTPYVPSPLLLEGSLYFLAHYQGILTKVDARTGADQPGPMRLGHLSEIYASPVAAAGRIYVTGRDGTTVVVSHREFPKILAVNALDEPISASAAIAGKAFFLRGERYLYCLGRDLGP
jgi:outer membrane protein assembly factor BamB